MHPHQRVASSAAGPSFLRPIGLKLKKSASLLEWLNKKLAEQGESLSMDLHRLHSAVPCLSPFRAFAKSPSLGRVQYVHIQCQQRMPEESSISQASVTVGSLQGAMLSPQH